MESYVQLRNRQEKESNEFPFGFAFNNNQFEEMMKNWGLTVKDTDKIFEIGVGGFIRKTDRDAMYEMFRRHSKELKDAIENDEDGSFVYKMFCYELRNHEYCITGDVEPALQAIGLTLDEVMANPKLLKGFTKAERKCRDE